ncbi:phenylalanine--tRNA ligase subunit alpha [Candidatus Dependentiae bacterium]|nr:phenylalanine--tRNA ligase subunit alpha [Candidatus Dependentiae bacterium]
MFVMVGRRSMSSLKREVEQAQEEFSQRIDRVTSVKDLEVVRIDFLGRQGKISTLFKQIKTLSVDEKKELVPLLNNLKNISEDLIKKSKDRLVQQQAHAVQLKQKNFDVTAGQTGLLKGHSHLYSQFIEEIENIFISMGYDVLDGPYVETDYYNFTALNIPQDHPARDMYDTFWLNKKNLLLRTHTSPVQVRTMEHCKPPFAAVVPGFTFRHEATDATHDTMFAQCEGFVIDKNITLSHLFATAQTFLKTLFKTDDLDIRIRPGFFPFVEPGVEIDMRCPFCKSGCSVCKKTTWLEVFPGGLIHPNVLRAGGIDPEEYSGFAFGFGLTRLAMLKYKVNDIRLFLSGKLKFLEQF